MDSYGIGQRIRGLREQRGLTQAQLSEELGVVHREYIGYWETGARRPKAEMFLKMADLFGVSCDYLMRGVSAEYLDIYHETGLTEKAVNVISKSGGPGVNLGDEALEAAFAFAPQTLNDLLCCDYFGVFISTLEVAVQTSVRFSEYKSSGEDKDNMSERLKRIGELKNNAERMESKLVKRTGKVIESMAKQRIKDRRRR